MQLYPECNHLHFGMCFSPPKSTNNGKCTVELDLTESTGIPCFQCVLSIASQFVLEMSYEHPSVELSSVRYYDLHFLTFPFQYCFAIMYRRQNQRQYELRAETTSECQGWIEEIKAAR